MTKNLLRYFLLFTLCLFMVSWGGLGHQTISRKSPDSFPSIMSGFGVWADSLSIHASDADNRKSVDPNEDVRHFIDIDVYSEFKTTGRIASTYDSIVNIHGASYVIYNGTLPYSTRITYDSLKSAFKKRKWHSAMLYASDLGHYVADGHMPMHITSNYNGQLTGNSGIHSRYESSLVSTYITSLSNYTGSSVNKINDVNNYIFAYIYKNYHYVDSLLQADTYAKNIAGGSTTSAAYFAALWSKTQFTTSLFKNASHAIAELIYSAWVDAGSPAFGSLTPVNVPTVSNISVYPNPTTGKLNLVGDNILKAEIKDITGKLMGSFNGNQLDISHFANGMYILNIYRHDGLIKNEKIILVK